MSGLHVCLCGTCVLCVCGQMTTLDSLRIELKRAMSCLVAKACARNPTQDYLEEEPEAFTSPASPFTSKRQILWCVIYSPTNAHF